MLHTEGSHDFRDSESGWVTALLHEARKVSFIKLYFQRLNFVKYNT